MANKQMLTRICHQEHGSEKHEAISALPPTGQGLHVKAGAGIPLGVRVATASLENLLAMTYHQHILPARPPQVHTAESAWCCPKTWDLKVRGSFVQRTQARDNRKSLHRSMEAGRALTQWDRSRHGEPANPHHTQRVAELAGGTNSEEKTRPSAGRRCGRVLYLWARSILTQSFKE